MPQNIKERDIRKYFIKRLKEARNADGEIRKVGWINRDNAPDELAMMPGWGFYAFVELKRPGEVPTPAQAREHTRMRKSGLRVEWVNCYEDVDSFFTRAERLRLHNYTMKKVFSNA